MAENNPLSDIEKLTHSIAVLNDAMITFAENLGKINKLETKVHQGEEQAIKDQERVSDMFSDSADAMADFNTTPEKVQKSMGFFGGSIGFMHNQVARANKGLEDFSTTTVLTGKELNFFAQNRRREQIATIKSFGSLRKALMLSASFLSGVFLSAMKAVVGALGQAGQAGAKRGTGIEAVVGKSMEGPKSLVESGIPLQQAMESTMAMFDAGLSRNVKGMHQFTKMATLLNMDIKRLAGHTRNLALTTGMSNAESVSLVGALQSTARFYNLNSERLIQAMEQLTAATAQTAMLAGKETSKALQEGTALLAAKLGAGGEDMAAKLMASLNTGNKEAFVTLKKFGVDFEKALGSEGGQGIESEITKFASVVTGMMRSMGGGGDISYSDPVLLGMMERLTGLSSDHLVTLTQLSDSARKVTSLTAEGVLAEQEATAMRIVSTDFQRQMQIVLSDIYSTSHDLLLPIIQGTFSFLTLHGDRVRAYLTGIFTASINMVKGILSLAKTLIIIKGISLLFKAAWAAQTVFNRITFQREMIARTAARTQLVNINMGIQALPARMALATATKGAVGAGVGGAVARGAAGGAMAGGWLGALAGIALSVGALVVGGMVANDKLGDLQDTMTTSVKDKKLMADLNAELEKSNDALEKIKETAMETAQANKAKDPGMSLTDMLQRSSVIQEDLTREMINLLQERNDELRTASSYSMLKRDSSWGK